MALNTYPEVARSKFTCNLYAIEFSYQFLVIQDMSQSADITFVANQRWSQILYNIIYSKS